MGDDLIISGLVGVMLYPERIQHPETGDLIADICAMDESDLGALLCRFRQAAEAEDFDDADIWAFWHVMGLPLPYIVIRTNNRA